MYSPEVSSSGLSLDDFFHFPQFVLRAMVKPEGLKENPWFLTPDFHSPAWCSVPAS